MTEATKRAADAAAKTAQAEIKKTEDAAKATNAQMKDSAETMMSGAFEMPNVFRDLAEKSASRAKQNYDTYKSMTEDATGAMEDVISTTNKNVGEVQRQALTSAKEQMNAGFDFAENMLKVRTVSEAFELQASFMRQQFETMQENFKQFQSLSSKMQQDSSRPFADSFTKAMEQWRIGG